MIPDSDPTLSSLEYEGAGTVRRVMKVPDHKRWIWLPVIRLCNEGSYHRVLPDCLIKFKHYSAKTIARSLNEDADLDLHDLPSDSTRERWKKLAYECLKRKSELKHSDSSGSLSLPLHNNNHFRDCTDEVEVDAFNQKFEPGMLARLFMLTARKRL